MSRRGPMDLGARIARPAGRALLYLFLFALAAACVFPYTMMIAGSTKDNFELVTMEQSLWPRQVDLRKYAALFDAHPFGRILLNTLFYTATKVAAGVFFCTLAGFAFAKYPFPGRNVLFFALLATMMIPFQSIIVPSYLLIRSFGWLNTFYGLIVPGLVPAFGVFLMRQYIIGNVPDELLDAARIDGSGEFRLFWLIGLPMTRSSALVLGILLFMQNWNAFLWPLVVVSREEMYLLTVAVQSIASNTVWTDYGIVFAATTLGSLPILAAFLVVQRGFISGLMSGFGK